MTNINLSKFAPVASLAIAGAIGLGVAPAPAAIITDGCASPTECTLDELFLGGTITVGDKFFSEWTFLDSDADPDEPPPIFDFSQVIVTPLDDDPNNPGLRFDWGDQFSDLGVRDFLNLGFAYLVNVTDPNFQITGTSLELLDFEVTGEGEVAVSGSPFDLENGDFFIDPITEEPAIPVVGIDLDAGIEILASDVNIPPQDAIGVTNTLGGDSDNLGGTFAVRSYEQRFNQTPIPEESSPWSLMLGVGALGAGSVVSKVLKSKSNK